jgi:integrase/recombinase XerD
MRLSTAVTEFLDASVHLSKATRDSYRSDLNLLVGLASVHAADSVLAFTPAMVRRYFLALSEKGLAMATLHKRRASVNEFAKYCLLRRLVADNPMTETPRIKRPKRLPRPFSGDIQERILALPLAGQERVMRALLFRTGVRVTELCELQVEHVALGETEEQGTVHVVGKGGRERVLPLDPETWHLLRDYLLAAADLRASADGRMHACLIARRDGRPFTRRMIERRTKAWGRRAGVTEKTTPHRFRHTFATELLEKGADLREVQEAMGHADANTTALYTEVTPERLRRAVNRLSRRGRAERVLGSGSVPDGNAPTDESATTRND